MTTRDASPASVGGVIRPTRASALALLAAGCVLAAGAASTGPFLAKDREVPPFRYEPFERPERDPDPPPTGEPGGVGAEIAQWVDVAVQAVVVVVAAALLAYGVWKVVSLLARLVRLRFGSSTGRVVPDEYDRGEESDADAQTVLRRRVVDELSLLSADLDAEPDPREAVIACYVRMERALADAGTPRGAAESPMELLGRVLGEYDVPEGDVRRLTALFTEARFSGHPVGDEMRAAAQRSLRAIADALGATA